MTVTVGEPIEVEDFALLGDVVIGQVAVAPAIVVDTVVTAAPIRLADVTLAAEVAVLTGYTQGNLWVGEGSPPSFIDGAAEGDGYLDALTGDVYVLRET